MPFQIVRNDITKMHVDAIVNTANPAPGDGDFAPGCSVITEEFDLPAKYIIHTVGTAWHGGNNGWVQVGTG